MTGQLQPPTDWMEIGLIVAPQGLKGEMRVYPHSDFPERFEEPGERWLYSEGLATPQSVQLQRGYYIPGKDLYVIKLANVENRNQAEALRGKMLVVPTTDRLELDEGEYHVLDLIGLRVFLQETGAEIGVVVDMMKTGNDLLVIKAGDKEVMVPFVASIVPVVDMVDRRIEITPPAGLLSLND
jgi:16S rRNA processing protein RimM